MRILSTLIICSILFCTSAAAQPTAYAFLEFSGKVIRQKPVITWQTQQELSLAYFNIERSFDGSDFQTIASPAAKGKNSGINYYDFADVTAAAGAERVFYRLQCIDKNGTVSYSSILKLQMHAHQTSLTLMGSGLIRSELNLNISAVQNQDAMIVISNQQGVVVKQQPVYLFDGTFIQAVDISLLPKGLYFVSVRTSNENLQQRFLKK